MAHDAAFEHPRYEVLRLLGAGGMGRVLLARDRELGREVAVKVLAARVRDVAQVFQRFQREALLQARVEHPNVVRLYDSDFTCREPFLVMEAVRGEDLERVVGKGGPLPAVDLAEAARQLGAGLAALHAAGVVHRDLKPGNVMRREDGSFVVMDLGLAAASDVTVLTATGLVVGTPRYLSPEMAASQEAGPASDQFQMAAILFFLATGRHLNPGETVQALLSNLDLEEYAAFEPEGEALPYDAQQAIYTGARRDPRARFPDCRALGEAVAAAVEGPVELPERPCTRRPTRRWLWVVPAAAALFLGYAATPRAPAPPPPAAPSPFDEGLLGRAAAEVGALGDLHLVDGELAAEGEGPGLLETTPDPYLFGKLLVHLPVARHYLLMVSEGFPPETMPEPVRAALREVDADLLGAGLPAAYHPGVGPGPTGPVPVLPGDLWLADEPPPASFSGWMGRAWLAHREAMRLRDLARADLDAYGRGELSGFPAVAVRDSRPGLLGLGSMIGRRLTWSDLGELLDDPGARAATARWLRDLGEVWRLVVYAAGRASRAREPGHEMLPRWIGETSANRRIAWASGAMVLPLEVLLGGPIDTPALRRLAAAVLGGMGELHRRTRLRPDLEEESLRRWEEILGEAAEGPEGDADRVFALRGLLHLLVRYFRRDQIFAAVWARYLPTIRALPPARRLPILGVVVPILDEPEHWGALGDEGLERLVRDLEAMWEETPPAVEGEWDGGGRWILPKTLAQFRRDHPRPGGS